MTNQRFRPVKKLAVRVIDGKAVMLTIADSKLHRLNVTATRVWQGIEGGKSPAEIVEALCVEFGIARANAQADVDALLHDLEQKGIVEALSDSVAEAPR